ncbi:MAG: hypothetical protein AUH01_05565 [Acidobacteria bacterium 13_2_20CM_56_17]|nr:MAG: hypothetical protein AUH01_05565 [Acidobacteria bacterium 13_2_20CM_56_17]PYS64841.1 MAG: hypothetical protein DMF76_04035 [Acidobacteriota bacterium]
MLRRVETVGATQGLPFLRRLSAKARVLLPRTQEIKLAARRHLVPFRSSGGGQTARRLPGANTLWGILETH